MKLAVGVGAGYLLGRTRKMRLALTLAGAAMARRSSGGITQELLERGTSLLKSSPELAGITDTVREQLMGAARAAAVTAASNRIDALNARLQQRAAIPEAEEELLDETSATDEEEYPDETAEGDEQGYADEDIEDEYPEEEDEYREEEDEYPEEEEPEVEAEIVADESEGSRDESEESRAPAPARRTASATRRRGGESRLRKTGAPERAAASSRRRRIRAEAEEAPIRRTRR
ncbi:hypothetical protein [Nocardia sp. R6R-6]|uniref:hypothetical protein n=1 Tax=Nocardia sp. R6R-6 TaxID=3459303 RepID=UPI00403DF786